MWPGCLLSRSQRLWARQLGPKGHSRRRLDGPTDWRGSERSLTVHSRPVRSWGMRLVSSRCPGREGSSQDALWRRPGKPGQCADGLGPGALDRGTDEPGGATGFGSAFASGREGKPGQPWDAANVGPVGGAKGGDSSGGQIERDKQDAPKRQTGAEGVPAAESLEPEHRQILAGQAPSMVARKASKARSVRAVSPVASRSMSRPRMTASTTVASSGRPRLRMPSRSGASQSVVAV